MDTKRFGIDTLLAGAASGELSRRDILKASMALGMGSAFGIALANAQGASAQDGMTLTFDAGATQGGGGRPNAEHIAYSFIINGGSQFEINRMVDARLVTLSADLQEFVGDLAESWEVVDNVYTFNLRQNAVWHDGTPVTAKDVVFTINLLTDPATTSRWGSSFRNVAGYAEAQEAETPTSLTGVTAPDDYTVQIELANPDSGMLSGFIFINILPEHVLGTADRATITELPYWTTNERIGAGPFKFVQLVEGERVELVAHEEYHHGAPAIKNLNLLFFSSAETSLAALQAGENMAAPMSVNELELVQGIDGAEVIDFPAGVGVIFFNALQPELNDKRVRQAIAYAIDKKTICETLFQGYADPVSTEIPYVEWAQPDDANPYDYDPEQAKALLEEAGFTGERTLGLWYYYTDPVTANVMEAMQQYLAAVGINTELKFDDGSGVRTQEIADKTWDMTYGSFGAQPSPANLTAVWGPPGEVTYGWLNDDFNAEMDAALATYEREEQAVHYQNAIRILNEESPSVWLFDRKNLIALNSAKLQNSVWGPGHIYWMNRANEWTVAE
ncbi:MAG: ABC transporter substrate-binding protein [Thermomicrobiales bacterium]|nr:ABC transporter substrate-binding protein [Thermomicrobiales bacterium]